MGQAAFAAKMGDAVLRRTVKLGQYRSGYLPAGLGFLKLGTKARPRDIFYVFCLRGMRRHGHPVLFLDSQG